MQKIQFFKMIKFDCRNERFIKQLDKERIIKIIKNKKIL